MAHVKESHARQRRCLTHVFHPAKRENPVNLILTWAKSGLLGGLCFDQPRTDDPSSSRPKTLVTIVVKLIPDDNYDHCVFSP